MKVELTRAFTFDAAHRLPHVPKGHKCGRLHGHTYRITLLVAGEVDPKMGWLQDFAELGAAFEPLRAQLDHYTLNDIEGLANPTAENLAAWIWQRAKKALPFLAAVTVNETEHSGCTYRGA